MSVVILSSAYCNQEFWPEIGKIPPAFLPLGNKRLFEYQIELFQDIDVRKYFTIPNDFNLNEFDRKLLSEAGFSIIRVDPYLSINGALQKVISLVDDNRLTLLFGDTLVKTLPKEDDYCVISSAKSEYSWGEIALENFDSKTKKLIEASLDSFQKVVHCGAYNFSNLDLFKQTILRESLNFTQCLLEYNRTQKLNFPLIFDWLDFGHLKTYFSARVTKTTERKFNKLAIDAARVIKNSTNKTKLSLEMRWYEELPSLVKLHTPKYLGETMDENKQGYGLEYLHLFPLNELYIYGKDSSNYWKEVIDSILDMLTNFTELKFSRNTIDDDLDYFIFVRSLNRIEDFLNSTYLDACDSITLNGKRVGSVKTIVDHLFQLIRQSNYKEVSFWHGDLCFSNIFYDANKKLPIVIDPRGSLNDRDFSNAGPIIYDVAKLNHSINGLYDQIISKIFFRL